MTAFQRLVVPEGSYFFTVRLQDRQSRLLVDHIDLLRASIRLCQKRWPMLIEAAVILPDHLHMIWTLPKGDGDFSARWRLIKSSFSRHVESPTYVRQGLSGQREKRIWQRRFWEHRIRDAAEFAALRSFILTAPVRAGLVARPQDWAHSSIHRDQAVVKPPLSLAALTDRSGQSETLAHDLSF